ncbi:MAG: DNA polymerase III subunit delta [Alkaliphilus sp.]|nr:DNA polymerase III subunit delta [Alkaliphilus sp.]
MEYKDVLEELKRDQLGHLYLFHGIEKFHIEYTLQKIKEKIVSEGLENLNFQVIEGKDANLDTLKNACETTPFLRGKRMVIIKDLENLYSKKSNTKEDEENKLIKYIENLPEYTHLFFSSMEPIDSRKKIVKAIAKNGKIVEFPKLSSKDLSRWIQKTFLKYKKEISEKQVHVLMETIGYLDKNSVKNLQDVENEIKKICNYIGDRTNITNQDIEIMTPKNLDNNIFSLVEAIGLKNGGKAFTFLNDILLDGESEIRVLHMISRQFRFLYQVKLLEKQGYTSTAIASKINVQAYVAKKFLSQAMNFDVFTLENAMKQCLQTDIDMKKGKIAHRLGIEILISKFVHL